MRRKQGLFEQKALLAKILARENIHVVHRNVRTAMFHPRTRTLTMPIFKDEFMTGDVYDLFALHEVSHALHTGPEGWHEAKPPAGKGVGYKSYLNVVEDARIEKLIKRRYPGAVKCMIAGYNKLNEMDFFDIKQYGGNLKRLKLIDRLNLHMKLGSAGMVPFNMFERKWVERMEQLETWTDVITLTDELYVHEKEHEKEFPKQDPNQQQSKDDKEEGGPGDVDPDAPAQPPDDQGADDMPPEDDEDQDEDGGGDDEKDDEKDQTGDAEKDDGKSDDEDEDADDERSSGDGDDDENNDEKPDGASGGDGEDEDDEEEEDEDSDADDEDSSSGGKPQHDEEEDPQPPEQEGGQGAGEQPPPDIEEDPQSETDTAFRERDKLLNDTHGKGVVYFDIPEPTKKCIIEIPDNIKKFEREVRRTLAEYQNSLIRGKYPINYDKAADEIWSIFYRKNNAYVNQLVKEFELRKNATQYARTRISRSGELDQNRIARYQLTDDLFRRVSTTDRGKSHGLIMYIDWSGSMSDIFYDTMEQMLILSMFCDKVNIPYDVYAFCDTNYDGSNDKFVGRHGKDKTLVMSEGREFALHHILSSESNRPEFRAAQKMCIMAAFCYTSIGRDKDIKNVIGDYMYSHSAAGVQLGGTPTCAMVVASRWMIPKFQQRTRVDIVNVIHLTDGDGGDTVRPPFLDKDTVFGIRDPMTAQWVMPEEYDDNIQVCLTQLVRYVTGCRHIGVYVGGDSRGMLYKAQQQEVVSDAQVKKMFSEQGYAKVPILGYNQYFLMPSHAVTDETDKLKVDSKGEPSQEQLVDAMRKLAVRQRQSRAMCTEFAKEITEQLKPTS